MFCRNVKNDLSAYLQGELKPAAASSVRAHLEKCAACRTELEKIQHGIQIAERLPVLPAPEELWQSVDEQIRKRHAQLGLPPKRNLLFTFALPCAAVILIAFLVWFF